MAIQSVSITASRILSNRINLSPRWLHKYHNKCFRIAGNWPGICTIALVRHQKNSLVICKSIFVSIWINTIIVITAWNIMRDSGYASNCELFANYYVFIFAYLSHQKQRQLFQDVCNVFYVVLSITRHNLALCKKLSLSVSLTNGAVHYLLKVFLKRRTIPITYGCIDAHTVSFKYIGTLQL